MIENTDINSKVKSGTIWTFAAHFIGKSLSLIVGVVLARILSPSDFGVVAVALVVWQLIMVFGATGVGSKLIQQQEHFEHYATAAFWLNIAVACILAIIAVFISPLASIFYETPLIKPIIFILALGLLITSLGNTHATLLSKEMAFKGLAFIEVSTAIISNLITLAMVLTGFGVWSLVIPNLCITPIRVFALWRICPWRPSLKLEIQYWREIFNFGKYVFGTSVLRYMNINGDFLIIGKLLGTEALGLYNFGYNLASWPVENLVWVASRVAFPAFSKLQQEVSKMRVLYLGFIENISLISFPMFIGLIFVADDLIPLVYGEKWMPAILPLKIMISFMVIRSISSIGGHVLMALGRPSIEFKFNALQVVPLIIVVLIGAQFGIVGVALGMTIVLGIFSFMFLRLTAKAIDLSIASTALTISPAFICSAIMGVCVYMLSIRLHAIELGEGYVVLASVALGILVYILSMFILFRPVAKKTLILYSGMIFSRPLTSPGGEAHDSIGTKQMEESEGTEPEPPYVVKADTRKI